MQALIKGVPMSDHLSANSETLLDSYRDAVQDQKQFGWAIDLTHVVSSYRSELLKRGVNPDSDDAYSVAFQADLEEGRRMLYEDWFEVALPNNRGS